MPEPVPKVGMARSTWDIVATLFARTNDAQLQFLKNKLRSVAQESIKIQQYFMGVKNLGYKISQLDQHSRISDAKMRCIVTSDQMIGTRVQWIYDGY